MASGKVYVGYAIDTSTNRGEREWVRIEPFLSGYRTERHQFEPVTDYSWLHAGSADPDQRPIEDFDILLPAEEIRSVHAFDMPTYLLKFKQSEVFEGPLMPLRDRRDVQAGPSKAECFYFAYAFLVFAVPAFSLFGGAWGLILVLIGVLITGWAASLDEISATEMAD
ncbi:hypothetical protein FHW69_001039 [Luteibacter sp. Sphag1AF]|uniref:hypothetical protein n=1 Tax=Luteibacter sp. Sphag1AF TaxID=2587031 RepID=UPI00160E6979|nr:hypothetical protein [Luteibacter sp. Sphag1AF]MBB3226449.1 hypothetical protein [Luteibacter sp. Sphag1AF]